MTKYDYHIGSDSWNDIVIKDFGVSSRHARVFVNDIENIPYLPYKRMIWALEDLDSEFGTFHTFHEYYYDELKHDWLKQYKTGRMGSESRVVDIKTLWDGDTIRLGERVKLIFLHGVG